MPWSGSSTRRTVLFDLDDTILDLGGSAEDWHAVCKEAEACSHAIDADRLYDAIERAQLRYWADADRHRLGRLDLPGATRHIVADALSQFGLIAPVFATELAVRYRQLREESITIFPRAIETLESLLAEGVVLGLLTNGAAAPQRAKVERFDLARYFGYIGIEGEVGVGKPRAQAYERALVALSSNPADAWMIGDNFEWEVLAPKRLGMAAIWVNRHGKPVPSGAAHHPDRIIADISELL